MSITNLTLDYINQYIQRNKIEVPKDINLASIFQECDRFDEEGNEVKDGDGILQIKEVGEFLKKVGEYGFKFSSAMYDCYKEVLQIQEQEELEAEQQKLAEQLANPPHRTDADFTDKAFDYMIAKLKAAGIDFLDIDMDLLMNIYYDTDWDMDEDFDSTITKEEADRFYDSEFANAYMNKDENGRSINTHVLDWIVNNYLTQTKPGMGL